MSTFYRGTSQTLPSARSVDWTLAGLRDTTTVGFQIIDLQQYNLIGDGITPNDSMLSIVLASVPGSGAVLLFPTGDFLFNKTIEIPNNIIFRGQGASSTALILALGGNSNGLNIQGKSNSSDTTSLMLTAHRDSNHIIVANNALFSTGDWVQIIQHDSDLVTSSWAQNTVGQIAFIEEITPNKIILGSPLRMEFSIERRPYIKKIIPVKNVGIECLKISRIDDTSPLQTSHIRFRYAVNCWVKGIESENCNFSHIEAEYSSNLSISHSYFHHAFEYGSGGRAYGVMLHFTSNECLIEDNIFEHLRHSMILQAGANGNVFSYNYSFDPFWSTFPNNAAGDMVIHGNYPYSNLFEQNICQNIVVDNSHGPNGPYNTFFRNRAESFGVFFSAANSPNQNILGNDIPNTTSPFNLVNYTIRGSGHFIHGNNNKGTIDPPGTMILPDQSYAYGIKPAFIPIDQWAAIGIPNIMGEASIPSRDRYNAGNILTNNCNDVPLNVEGNKYQGVDIRIYPNPTYFYLKIESDQIIQNIKIMNGQGNILCSFSHAESSYEIDTYSWIDGFYYAIITFSNSMSVIRKVIKIR